MTESSDTSRQDAILDGILSAAKEISRKHAEILSNLADALIRDDTDAVIKYARELCGLAEDWKLEEERRALLKSERAKKQQSKSKQPSKAKGRKKGGEK
ncbi:MAG TPA: hypothetical protein VGC87_23190 [Pyrinomonadaceae bacterium]|jgi:hypothetical protein